MSTKSSQHNLQECEAIFDVMSCNVCQAVKVQYCYGNIVDPLQTK